MRTFSLSAIGRFFASIAFVITAVTCLNGCRRSPEQKAAGYIESGKAFAKKQDYPSAILQFSNALRLTPGSPDLLYELALAHLGNGTLREAIQSLVRATQINPKHTAAQVKLAELMVLSHKQQLLEQAQARLQIVLADHPDNGEALFVLASTEAQAGRLDNAEKYLNDALTRQPTNLRSASALALVKLSQKDWTAAERILVDATTRAGGSAESLVALGELYLFGNRTSDAEAAFRRALARQPDHAPALLHIAALEMQAGRLDAAEATYRRISELKTKGFEEAYPSFLLRQGKSAAAIEEFRRVLDATPDNRNARTGLIAAYLAANRPADARAVLDAALAANSKDIHALLQRAHFSLRSGKFTEAQQDLTSVLRFQPTSAEAHYLLSEVYRSQDNLNQQKQELMAAVERNPELLAARIELARVLIRSKTPQAAVEMMKATPTTQAKLPAAIAQRNWALLATGNREAFAEGVAEGLAIEKTPEFLLQEGVLRIMRKDFSGAESALTAVLTANPEDTRALEALAQAYVQQKRPDAALRLVQDSAAKQPRSFHLQMFAGNWLEQSGRNTEARASYKAADAASPGYPATVLALARIDAFERKFDEARRRLTALLNANEQNGGARLMLALVEEAAGHTDVAVAHYRKMLEISPDNVTALNNLAYLMSARTDQLDEALAHASRAKELAPNVPMTDDTLGWILYRKGFYKRALQHLESAAARSPHAAPKYHLAMTYIQLGDLNRGQRLFDAAMKLDPNAEEAKVAQSLLAERAGRKS